MKLFNLAIIVMSHGSVIINLLMMDSLKLSAVFELNKIRLKT